MDADHDSSLRGWQLVSTGSVSMPTPQTTATCMSQPLVDPKLVHTPPLCVPRVSATRLCAVVTFVWCGIRAPLLYFYTAWCCLCVLIRPRCVCAQDDLWLHELRYKQAVHRLEAARRSHLAYGLSSQLNPHVCCCILVA